MNSTEAMEAKLNDKVKIRIANNEEENAKIVQINEESGKRTIIFQINKMTDVLINHRKISVKVPNQALTQENGLYYITRNRAGVQTKILVKIKKQAEKYSIIESYKNEELQEIGYSIQDIRNYKKISNYDEVMLNN